jgi:hypothetical protein
MPLNTVLRKCFKSPNPAVNVRRRDEPIATDTIQSDVPAIDGGEKYAQIFVGTKSLVTDVHGMKSPAQFPGILTDEIITRGAPTKLISDSARVETSKEVWNSWIWIPFPVDLECTLLCAQVDRTRYSSTC